MPNSKSVVGFLLVDFGWWVTMLGMVADHPWQLSPGLNFASKVWMPNCKSVVPFFLVGGRPSQLLVQLTWTVLPDWTVV